VGYRYYDTSGVKPLYPFGHGLSYTEFEYSSLKAVKSGRGAGFRLEVSLLLKNTGGLSGSETAQLYVSAPERSVHGPVKELKGFEKVNLAAEQEKEISFSLDLRAFSYYSTDSEGWIAEAGRYDIIIGSSSADERLRTGIQLTGDDTAAEQPRVKAAVSSDYRRLSGDPGLIHNISDSSFEQALGRPLPKNVRPREYNRNTTLNEFSNSFAGKVLLKFALKKADSESAGNENSAGMYSAMIREMPLRAVVSFSGGRLSSSTLDAIIEMANGRKIKGLAALARSLISR
jgi:beta-glucosidase